MKKLLERESSKMEKRTIKSISDKNPKDPRGPRGPKDPRGPTDPRGPEDPNQKYLESIILPEGAMRRLVNISSYLDDCLDIIAKNSQQLTKVEQMRKNLLFILQWKRASPILEKRIKAMLNIITVIERLRKTNSTREKKITELEKMNMKLYEEMAVISIDYMELHQILQGIQIKEREDNSPHINEFTLLCLKKDIVLSECKILETEDSLKLYLEKPPEGEIVGSWDRAEKCWVVPKNRIQPTEEGLNREETIHEDYKLFLQLSTLQDIKSDSQPKCSICLENENSIILGCGHKRTCVSCTKKLIREDQGCPYCRKRIEMATKIFE